MNLRIHILIFVSSIHLVNTDCGMMDSSFYLTPDLISITYIDGNTETGSEAIFSCPRGYNLTGTRRTQCDGDWDVPQKPKCVAIECPVPCDIAHGEVHFANHDSETKFKVGSASYVECEPDFVLTGPYIRICMENGSWSGEPNNCKDTHSLCDILPSEVKNGTVQMITNISSKNRHQILFRVSCNNGFILNGASNIVECGASYIPKCEPEHPKNERYISNFSTANPYFNQETFKVNKTLFLVISCVVLAVFVFCLLLACKGSYFMYCAYHRHANGYIDPDSSLKVINFMIFILIIFSGVQTVNPDCGMMDSSYYLTPDIVSITYIDGHTGSGSEAIFSCPRGYNLTGTRRTQCDGDWHVPQKPECVVIECSVPGNIAHGEVHFANHDSETKFKVGSAHSVECEPDFVLTGAYIRRCMENGSWSGEPNNCTDIYSLCNITSEVNNGTIQVITNFKNNNRYQVLFSVSCNNGFILNGSSNIVECGSQYIPTCEPDNPKNKRYISNISTANPYFNQETFKVNKTLSLVISCVVLAVFAVGLFLAWKLSHCYHKHLYGYVNPNSTNQDDKSTFSSNI